MTADVQIKDTEEISRILDELLVRSEAETCLLCDSGGHVLAHHGVKREDPFALGALGAGVFAASKELARMLGETEFDTVFHQGRNTNLLIRGVTPDVLLVIIFTHATSLGLVKLYTDPATAALQSLFETIRTRGAPLPVDDHRSFVLRDQVLFTAQPPS